MIKTLTFMIAAMLFATAHAQWTEPVRISSDPHLGIPRAVAVGDTMHVAATTHFNIYYLRSNNNGETWTDPICPLEDFYGSRTPDIVSSNGKLHMAFIGREQSGEPTRVYIISSSDGGRSWGDPYEVYYNGWKYPRLAGTGDTLFLSCAIPGQILVLVSYDNGQTWSEPSIVDSGPLVIDHPPIISYSGGRLHIVYQINIVGASAGVEIYHRYSDDQGDTWSERFPLSTVEYDPDYRHSQFPSAMADSLGNVMALWFDYKYGSECGVTGDILGRVSRDNGESWERETRLTVTQTGFMSTCLISNDSIYAVWMDYAIYGCSRPTLMYTISDDWGRSWDSPRVVYGPVPRNEYGPHMAKEESDGQTVYHGVFWSDPEEELHDPFYFRSIPPITGVDEIDDPVIPVGIEISSYPNPFNSATTISLENREGGDTEIAIFNLLGQRVRSFTIDGAKEGRIIWDATDALGNKVSSGIYFAKARTHNNYTAIKLVYMK